MKLIRLLDILFPARCISCHMALSREKAAELVCAACRHNLVQKISAFTCPKCGGRLPMSHTGLPAVNRRCHPKVPYLLVSAARYENVVARTLIHVLKFKRRISAARVCGELLAQTLQTVAPHIDGVVAISLSTKRLRSRGFNQSEYIAQDLAQRLHLPYLPDTLRRIRHTASQSELQTREARFENVANCFVVNDPEAVRGKSIILVDDVWTTGATMQAAATVLKVAGARQIIGAVVARAR